MAIEDAGALGVLLSGLQSADEVQERLQLYQDVRKNRVCAMQLLSSWATLGYDTVIEKSKKYLGDKTPSKLWCVVTMIC